MNPETAYIHIHNPNAGFPIPKDNLVILIILQSDAKPDG